MVSEGSGENIFLIRYGRDKATLITPSFGCSVLPGITRRTVITLAEEIGLKVIEEPVPREALYIADEVFFTGSAAEITPISKIDGIVIGEGRAGKITKQLQKAFFDIVEGRVADRYEWLTYVPAAHTVKV
jgi:branched-chain amino acid aminotransferase